MLKKVKYNDATSVRASKYGEAILETKHTDELKAKLFVEILRRDYPRYIWDWGFIDGKIFYFKLKKRWWER